MTTTFKLYWVRADEQGSYDMGSYASHEEAEAAIPAMKQELLDQQGEQSGRDEIEAGRWAIEAE